MADGALWFPARLKTNRSSPPGLLTKSPILKGELRRPARRSTSERKLPSKPNVAQPAGNQLVTAGFLYGHGRLGKTRRIAPSSYKGTFAPRNRVCEKTGDCPKRRARAWRFINDLREARWTVPRFFHRPNSKGQERTIEAAEPPNNRMTKQTQFLITAIDLAVYTTVWRCGKG